MGLLDRAIRKGVSDAVGKALGEVIVKAVEPKATELANKAANKIDQAAGQASQQMDQISQATQEAAQATTEAAAETKAAAKGFGGFAGLENSLGNLQKSLESFATEAAKGMKECPQCGGVTTEDKKFCPTCGAKLPETTLAQGAVCPQCGKQNTIGTQFCAECGAKLPALVAEETAQAEKSSAEIAKWDDCLAGVPKWTCGGRNFVLDCHPEDGYCQFDLEFDTPTEADNAIASYCVILRQNGFTGSPNNTDLSKRIGDKVVRVDMSHTHDGDAELPSIYFMFE